MVHTFNFKISLAGEIITFTDNALVPSTVVYFWIFDNQSKRILVNDKRKLFSFVTLLKLFKIK